ncbi:hypothetical protein ABZX98_16065 [Streptomyces sp. NPDC002992]|uniref:hypothetical protein n=1 Tax=Streptomyces sp. NPDC002992 TaxID=3154273 RepID=UPI0033A849C0
MNGTPSNPSNPSNPSKDTSSTRDSGPALLGIYLNDHLTGAGAGVELMRRICRAHRGQDFAPQLAELAQEVSEDRRTLRTIMESLGVRPLRGRTALGQVTEKVGRLKLNGHLFSRSPLSDLLELEAMRLGVEGKAAGWRSLHALARTDARLDAAELDGLVQRARRQSQTLESLRLRVAAHVLATGDRLPPGHA